MLPARADRHPIVDTRVRDDPSPGECHVPVPVLQSNGSPGALVVKVMETCLAYPGTPPAP